MHDVAVKPTPLSACISCRNCVAEAWRLCFAECGFEVASLTATTVVAATHSPRAATAVATRRRIRPLREVVGSSWRGQNISAGRYEYMGLSSNETAWRRLVPVGLALWRPGLCRVLSRRWAPAPTSVDAVVMRPLTQSLEKGRRRYAAP